MVCGRGDGAPTTMWPRRGGPTRYKQSRTSETIPDCNSMFDVDEIGRWRFGG